jgi:outer membrane protein assembly factor BamD (BamD/ComL family)
LDVETRSLGEAHGALQSGDAARALALLDKQSATYAQGELRQERAAARIMALCKLGRGAEARAAAESFLRENPRSPLTDRVRAACPANP